MSGYQIYMNDKFCKCKKPVSQSEILQMDGYVFKLEACCNCHGILDVGKSVHESDLHNKNITL